MSPAMPARLTQLSNLNGRTGRFANLSTRTVALLAGCGDYCRKMLSIEQRCRSLGEARDHHEVMVFHLGHRCLIAHRIKGLIGIEQNRMIREKSGFEFFCHVTLPILGLA